MTDVQKNSHGSIALVSVVIVVLVLIGALGFIGWQKLSKQNTTTTGSASTLDNTAEVIVTQDDLENAEKSLDELNFDDDDAVAAEQQADL